MYWYSGAGPPCKCKILVLGYYFVTENLNQKSQYFSRSDTPEHSGRRIRTGWQCSRYISYHFICHSYSVACSDFSVFCVVRGIWKTSPVPSRPYRHRSPSDYQWSVFFWCTNRDFRTGGRADEGGYYYGIFEGNTVFWFSTFPVGYGVRTSGRSCCMLKGCANATDPHISTRYIQAPGQSMSQVNDRHLCDHRVRLAPHPRPL